MKFVRIHEEYNNYLRKIESKVQDNSLAKSSKPFIGCLFVIDDMEYFVPLSSAKPKHHHIKESLTFHKIISQGKILAVLNICNMLPINNMLYNRIDISKEEPRYAKLLKKEYDFCKKNFSTIQKKAKNLYAAYKNKQLPKVQQDMCCDFVKLECAYKNYLLVKAKPKIENRNNQFSRKTARKSNDELEQ